MEEMKWFSSALLGVQAADKLGFGLALAGISLFFGQRPVPNRHGMSKISHTEPSQHCNIIHWTHMEDMKWFSSALLGVLAANSLGFGLALAETRKTPFGQQQCQGKMTCPNSATQSLPNIATSLIGPIWRK